MIFGSVRDAPPSRPNASNLYRRAADGSGDDERLTTSERQQRTNGITPDGKYLVLEEQTDARSYDFMLLPLQSEPRVEPLLQTPFDERNAAISPDGNWLAYESNESGQFQIYVRPFPNVTGGRFQVTDNGGRTPRWSPDGRELFFVSRTSMMTVPVQVKPTFTLGSLAKSSTRVRSSRRPVPWLHDAYVRHLSGRAAFSHAPGWQPHDDGNAPSLGMVVVQNWFEELKARTQPARGRLAVRPPRRPPARE